MAREIQLTQGKVAIVDDEDYEWLSQWKWCAVESRNTWYAYRQFWDKDSCIGKTVRMHSYIMNAKRGQMVDHIDGNGLNNQRSNLRFCDASTNGRNRKVNHGKKYKGVCYDKSYTKRWMASITKAKGKHTTIGRYITEIEAAIAYDFAAIRLFGSFANTNLPRPLLRILADNMVCAGEPDPMEPIEEQPTLELEVA